MANEQYELYQQGTAAALAQKQLALLNSKASPDANYPSLSAGSSTGILGDPETASWTERTTAADGAALIESVKGNTLRWNQLIYPNPRSVTSKGVTYTNTSDGKVTLDGTATGAETFTSSLALSVVSGHKYVYRGADVERAVYANIAGIGPKLNSGSIYTATSDIASTTLSVTVDATYAGTYECYPQLFDLTQMFGAGNEPATVAEFEALFPEPYYEYDAGSLLPVRMEGIETVGFNQWDEEWEVGGIDNATGQNNSDMYYIRSKNYIPVFPSTQYYMRNQNGYTYAYAADKSYIGTFQINNANTPANCRYIRFRLASNYGTTYQNDICINISDTTRNGEYEPYWRSERTIPAATYFPQGMRSAGSVYDELTSTEAIMRVGVVDLGTLEWGYSSSATPSPYFYAQVPDKRGNLSAHMENHLSCAKYEINETIIAPNNLQNGKMSEGYGGTSDHVFVVDSNYTTAAAFKTTMNGVMLHYALATPTTTPIDPPLPLSYRVGAGGTERVMVAEGTTSAPPIFVTRYPLDPADLAASIAPVDGPIAKTNHQVGDLLMLGFTLCKATQVIVTGETIEIGTNVTRTTVAAELAALSE